MPKEFKAKISRSSVKSASKGKKRAEVDESSWRDSRVSPNSQICKSFARQLYKLTPTDLARLSFKVTSYEKVINGEKVMTSMHLCPERDVERAAWRKHGGPEGFQARLEELRKKWPTTESGRKGKTFPEPNAYKEMMPRVVFGKVPRSPVDRNDLSYWNASPTLRELKSDLPRWLWRACNDHMDRVDADDDGRAGRFSTAERERAIQSAVRYLVKNYPERPDAKLPSSASVDAFRALLGLAPQVDEESMEDSDAKYRVDYDFYLGPGGGCTITWCDEYLKDLFESLARVIEEHGVEGWKKARWEVYDKYSDCRVGGLYYGRESGKWWDDAEEWLRGRIDKKPTFLPQGFDEGAWQTYNAMLPYPEK